MSDEQEYHWCSYRGNVPIEPWPQVVYAMDLGHAMQQVAPCLADDATRVDIWCKKRRMRGSSYIRPIA